MKFKLGDRVEVAGPWAVGKRDYGHDLRGHEGEVVDFTSDRRGSRTYLVFMDTPEMHDQHVGLRASFLKEVTS